MTRNRFVSSLLVLALVLPLTGCGKQTTLDRIASVLRVAADGFQLQLDQLKNQGVIDAEKYARLKVKADAIKKQTDELGRVIDGFGEIKPGDVPRILQQIDLVAGSVESALTDPAWTGPTGNLQAVRILRWIRATLATAAIVVAGLFPPPSSEPVAQLLVRDSVKAAKVRIDLPPQR